MLDSNGSFDNPFFQDKKIVKIDCKWKGQEYSKDTFGFTHAEYVCSFILKENPEAENCSGTHCKEEQKEYGSGYDRRY